MDVRKKLVELLGKAKHEFWCSREKYNGTEFVAGYLIAHGVTVQEWISVKDRLPEHDKLVLVCDANDGVHGYVGIWSFEIDKDDGSDCWYDSGGWWHPLEEVTHWMPLPQPPKGE